jgi:hypothetical protein
MRILGIVALSVALVGCATNSQEVKARLGEFYIGKSTDLLVKDFGPPVSTFKMQSGAWQLTSVTNITGDTNKTVTTAYCKVTVIADQQGNVKSLDTEDTKGGLLVGSLCARKLGIEHRS